MINSSDFPNYCIRTLQEINYLKIKQTNDSKTNIVKDKTFLNRENLIQTHIDSVTEKYENLVKNLSTGEHPDIVAIEQITSIFMSFKDTTHVGSSPDLTHEASQGAGLEIVDLIPDNGIDAKKEKTISSKNIHILHETIENTLLKSKILIYLNQAIYF